MNLWEYRASNGVGEVAICGMDYDKKLLTGVNGRIYYEPVPNIWADLHGIESDVIYLGTGKHAGGIVLRPLYIKIEGVWRHATNGKEVPPATLERLGRAND